MKGDWKQKMKRAIFLSLIALTLLSVHPAQAKSKDKAKAEAKQPAKPLSQQKDAASQERPALIADITNLRNQDLRAAILQQLLNEELVKLRNIQAEFCNKYKLDIEKLRKGLYSYDEKENKFVETKAESK